MDFIKLLHSLEDAIYEIVTWMVLIPKTLIKLSMKPGFIIPYIHSEKIDGGKNAFDEYQSPTMLWVLAVAIPNIYIFKIVDRVAEVIGQINAGIGAQISLLEGESRVAAGLVFSLLLPVSYLILIEATNEAYLSKHSIKHQIQIQCYVQAGSQIPAFLLVLLVQSFLPNPTLLSLIPYAVLAFYEAVVIKEELAVSRLKSVLISTIPLIFYFGMLYLVFPLLSFR